MSYIAQLRKATKWLVSVQNEDGGWGLAAGQASSIVNTAEALYVLTREGSDEYRSHIQGGLAFLQSSTMECLKRSPRTRYAFFAVLACWEHKHTIASEFPISCREWLFSARNEDGAWGHEARDGASHLYPTAMSIICLARFCEQFELTSACNWLIAKSRGLGWSFTDDSQVSAIATAMATLAIATVTDTDGNVFEQPKETLLGVSNWGTETEDMPGTPWLHCTYMWVFAALSTLGVAPYVKPIAQGVREINKLNCDYGWREPAGHLTIRGQFWAVFAFDYLRRGFDPAVHTYQIDSALAHSEMREPAFVSVLPHTKWAFVVPRNLYRFAAFALFCMSLATFFGMHRLATIVPRKVELLFAVACYLMTLLLVQKRKALFPIWAVRVVLGTVAVLSFLDLVFGYSVMNIFDAVTKAINGVIPR